MSRQNTTPDPAAALQQLLPTLEFVKIVSHFKECPKTGPSLARMVTDPTHGEANIDLLCTALVALQGLIDRMTAFGSAQEKADAQTPQDNLHAFMARLADAHSAPSADDADESLVH